MTQRGQRADWSQREHAGHPRSLDCMLALAAVVVIAIPPIVPAAEPTSMTAFDTQYVAEIRPLLQRFCFKCHASDPGEGDLDLQSLERFEDVRRDPSIWEDVDVMLENGEMPPEDSEQLDPKQRKRLRGWTQNYLSAEAHERSGDPGRVGLRQLNNAEFTYTIRDLTGLELYPARDFPADGAAGEGFTNAAQAAGMSPGLMEKYLDATREIAAHVVLVPDGFRFSKHTSRRDWIQEIVQEIRTLYARYTSGNSDVSILDKWKTDEGTHASANDGRVELEPYLFALVQHRDELLEGIDPGALSKLAMQSGLSPKYLWILARTLTAHEPDSLLLESIRRRWQTTSPGDVSDLAKQIRIWQDKLWKVNPVGLTGLVRPWREPISPEDGFEELRRTAADRAGGNGAEPVINRSFDDFRRVFPASMCFARIVPVDDHVTLLLYHREDEPLSRLMLDDTEQGQLDRLWDELLYVSHEPTELEGVLHGLLELDNDGLTQKVKPFRAMIKRRATEFRRQLVETEPRHLDALLKFLSRAYRRPLMDQELQVLRTLYGSLRRQSVPHEAAFRLTLARALTSASFLYRMETRRKLSGSAADHPEYGRPASHPVSDHELATRLSYFLWSSLPDEPLRADAETGRLTELADPQLIPHTRRMLQDSRVRRLAVEFACQWLHIRDFDQFEKSETHFPEFTDLRGSMYEESVRFFIDLFQCDRSILSLLQSDATFLNEQLAAYYSIPGVTGNQWQRVGGILEHGRGGILAQSAVLARHSGASRTNPILRGTFVAETLLGERLPRPPTDVPQLPESVAAGLSERDLIEQHSQDVACAGCHRRIDPYGFALESFDATGRLRSRDAGGLLPETQTTLADGTTLEGFDGLRRYLLTHRRDDFVRQFCRKLLGFALGRAVQLSDQPLLDKMMAQLSGRDFRSSVAVETIVMSDQFQMVRSRE